MHKDSSSANSLFFLASFILSFANKISFWYLRRPIRTDPFLRLAGYPVPSAFSCIRIQAAAPAGQPPVSRPTERCRRRFHPWFFAVLTVAPFSGFVQVALAPISQKLCGAPAPIRIFRGNHGEIPLISLDPDSLGLSPESPTPVPKAFHLRKGHSTCHPPLRTGVYQTRNCRYPLRRHKCKPPGICKDDG